MNHRARLCANICNNLTAGLWANLAASLPCGAGRIGWLMLALLAAPIAATTADAASEYKTAARTAILMEASTGAVLFEKDADRRVPPASMSKLMTLAIIFKTLKAGQIRLEDEFMMSVHAWRTGGAPSRTSAMMVPVNTRISLNELIQGIIVQSGNDAAISVAEGLAGSEAAFAKVMNAEAKRIGLTNSSFANPTGLDHPDQLMSARDLAILARHLIMQYPEFYKLFAQKEFKYRRHLFRNRNRLLFRDIGVDGLKTGYTSTAGNSMVASAVQDGRRIIAVLTGLETKNDRWNETQKMIEWGFKGFGTFKLFPAGEVVSQARVWGGSQMFVPLSGRGDVQVLLSRFPVNQKLRAEVIYKGPLKPPIKQGDEVAKLRVTSSTGVRNDVPLYATKDVTPAGTWWRGLDSLIYLGLGWVP
ncbi:MAG TPA: D-alanyl-D-alanine carboxypeptidase family protein [Hyphomicrobiaceae bacterium]|nr:D-alanyl-D-alanine carboxypeptidase family protein [Hyphomicrobiaceae bacterium]